MRNNEDWTLDVTCSLMNAWFWQVLSGWLSSCRSRDYSFFSFSIVFIWLYKMEMLINVSFARCPIFAILSETNLLLNAYVHSCISFLAECSLNLSSYIENVHTSFSLRYWPVCILTIIIMHIWQLSRYWHNRILKWTAGIPSLTIITPKVEFS